VGDRHVPRIQQVSLRIRYKNVENFYSGLAKIQLVIRGKRAVFMSFLKFEYLACSSMFAVRFLLLLHE
jgi:hypothetical protein